MMGQDDDDKPFSDEDYDVIACDLFGRKECDTIPDIIRKALIEIVATTGSITAKDETE